MLVLTPFLFHADACTSVLPYYDQSSVSSVQLSPILEKGPEIWMHFLMNLETCNSAACYCWQRPACVSVKRLRGSQFKASIHPSDVEKVLSASLGGSLVTSTLSANLGLWVHFESHR